MSFNNEQSPTSKQTGDNRRQRKPTDEESTEAEDSTSTTKVTPKTAVVSATAISNNIYADGYIFFVSVHRVPGSGKRLGAAIVVMAASFQTTVSIANAGTIETVAGGNWSPFSGSCTHVMSCER